MKHQETLLLVFYLSASLAPAQQATADLSDPNSGTSPKARPAAQTSDKRRLDVVKSWKADLGNHSIIPNRIAPPAQQDASARASAGAAKAEPAPAATPLEESSKKQEILRPSATVYDYRVTKLRWVFEQQSHRAFSNIDFNHLAGLGHFETEDTIYLLMLGLGNERTEEVAAFNRHAAERGWPRRQMKQTPPVESFSRSRAEYLVADGVPISASSQNAYAALDALHRYYDAHREQLARDFLRREAARKEHERWHKEPPPIAQETVLFFRRRPPGEVAPGTNRRTP